MEDEINRKNEGYQEDDILDVMGQVADGLFAMHRHSFPAGVLTADKIALSNDEGKKEKRYLVTVDHLMHPQLYRSG